ncbi:hypothetical protein Slin14017_G054150 [Septoria linicola]|nr:hypothetical protein Slin14017_G054150 [Septoria linicola]
MYLKDADFDQTLATTKPLATTAPIIDVGLAKTHARCLPCDIEFAPYQVDNVVFHFPLPPVVKSADASSSPIDSAVCIEAFENKPHMSAVVSSRPKTERQAHRRTRVNSARRNIPVRTSSLQPIDPPPPSYEESCEIVNQSTYYTNFQRQETLNRLEDSPSTDSDVPQFAAVTTRQLADVPQQKLRPARIGPPPTRPAPQRPLREEINPDFQRSSDALRRRAASLRHHQQEISTRPRSMNKAQIVLGLQQPKKSVVEQLFDQAVLEFQQQSPQVAEKIAQRNEIGAHRWASRTQRRILMDEQTFYTPGSTWRPTAKVHRNVVGGAGNITISTPALANRLGVAVGASAQLRIDAFYDDD